MLCNMNVSKGDRMQGIVPIFQMGSWGRQTLSTPVLWFLTQISSAISRKAIPLTLFCFGNSISFQYTQVSSHPDTWNGCTWWSEGSFPTSTVLWPCNMSSAPIICPHYRRTRKGSWEQSPGWSKTSFLEIRQYLDGEREISAVASAAPSVPASSG